MGLDEMVEQLAFGRTLPKFDSCIGISLSNDAIYLSEVHWTGAKPVVDHLLKVLIPPTSGGKDTMTRVAGSLNTDLLSDPERLAGLLRPAMTQTKWGSKYAVVTFSHHFGLLRYFIMPAVDRKFWKTAVPAESKKYIPIQAAELTNDFQVLAIPPGPDKRPRQGVLFGVTHNKNIAGAVAVCGKLGLTLVGVELAPCSVQRLLDALAGPNAGPNSVQVHFDGGWVRTLLSENGIPVFFREALLPDQGRALDVRKVDLAGCIDFCRKQLGVKPPPKVRLSGASPEQAGWRDALGAEVNLPVEAQDIPQTLGLKAAEWGAYAALGAGLKYLARHPLTVELSQFRRVSDEEKRAVYSILAVAGAIAGVMLLVGGARYGLKAIKDQDLRRMNRKMNTISAFKGKSADEIEKTITEMENKANSLARVAGSRGGLTKVLEYIAEDVPDALWLTSLGFVHQVALSGGGGGKSQTLTLGGHVIGPSVAAEQDIAFQFKDKLQADARFSQVFACSPPALSAQASAVDASGAGASTPDSLSSAQEGRTTFVIECAARQ